ncbi:3-isopropylmalate dehydratase small subunit [Methanocella paludicola SANAE]|uniref:3-isopropylmalate dehydratase small subunit n=1 Tax=Methanocella paludicola (strain DSM 17711 / JCM 13418 / NBRC 101707 / SANAE) TaxID=304371 RepID=D1Z2Z2_METPS|nr:3-isopropylmalate dehydratase small subunit [Methanocella paludicola]BAI63064.1 3-isopropylmalate dehydratase small subunit [Methanocella paludicola SANAE]
MARKTTKKTVVENRRELSRAWKFGDDVDTDAIIPGRFLIINDAKELAKHAFEGVRPDFRPSPGDVVVAGENFGCGSSREHAPLALKGAGIKCVIAKSFARIFFRNSVNIGLPMLECEDAGRISDGDVLEVEGDVIRNLTKGETYRTAPLPEFLEEIVRAGGLIEYAREIVAKEHKK